MSTDVVNSPIVVGIDGSESALIAMRWTEQAAAAHGWPRRLVNAYKQLPVTPTMVGKTALEVAEESLREARKILESSSYAGLEVSTVARPGYPSRVLVRESAQGRALVVGREGADLFTEKVLGSTSLACATHARVPVVMIPETWRPVVHAQRVITLCVDGSSRSRAAVEYAFATASRWKAGLMAVFAMRRTEQLVADAFVIDTESVAAARRMVSRQVAGWRSKLPDFDVTEVVEVGHPAAVIKERATDADLVVLGGRGHGAMTGMPLVSVAHAVLHHVDRPIAVVHELD
jgi:nucleotide-binding universal stress UspA family protein